MNQLHAPATTSALLTHRLELVYRWYAGMVDTRSGLLEYLYVPESDAFVREHCPIRDLASVWDVELLGEFLHRTDLTPVVERSLAHYSGYLVPRDGHLILDAHRLMEPASIAHSAFMLLALLHAPPPHRDREIAALAEGIRCQQRPDGSYKVYFDDLPNSGEELYAGEAMLALVAAYRHSGDVRYRESVERGFAHYDRQYFQRDRVGDDLVVFFANWQSQACRALFESTRDAALKRDIGSYLVRLHDRIIDSELFDRVERMPARQDSVEVACALEGLNDAYRVARDLGDARIERYRHCICRALAYLVNLQCTVRGTDRERGGFGLSHDVRAQRIDVTGHAASALMKSVANAIECPAELA